MCTVCNSLRSLICRPYTQNVNLKNTTQNIVIILLLFTGCIPQRNILRPIENSKLREVSNQLIYAEVDEAYRSNVIYNGAYKGFQCYREIEDLAIIFKEEAFECTCYDYKVISKQGTNLYIGHKGGYYLNTRVCFDSNNTIVEQPKLANLILALTQSGTNHLDLSTVRSITESELERKSKFGKFPVLVYDLNQNRLLWKAKRHFGKLNVSVHEFDLDAVTGKVLRHKKLPYKRTFWQWIGGTGI